MRKTALKRILFPLALLFCLLLTSCATAAPIESTEEESRVIGKVGEFDVKYEEFRFILLTHKQMMMDTYGENIFMDSDKSEYYKAILKNSVYENITANYAILTLCRDMRIEASDEKLQAAVQKKVEERIEELGGRGKYKKFLKENHMSDSFFRFNILVDLMQNELFYVYTEDLEIIATDDEAIYDAISNDFVRTQHIYISKSNGKTNKENQALIFDIYNSLKSGADFDEMMKKYGEDAQMDDNGIYIPRGYMSDEYDLTAFGLSLGSFSEIVEDDGGFYIIKRREIEPLYIMMNFDELKERYQNYAFLDIIDTAQSELNFIPTEYLESIDILKVK